MRLLQTVRRKLKPLVYPVLLAAGLVVLPARTVDGRSPQRTSPRVGAFELDPLGTRADSIALGQALGADLRDEAVRLVVDRLICPVSDTDCMQVDSDDLDSKVVEDTQQVIHNTFIDTTWPTYPHHRRHSLSFHDGAWWCEESSVQVAVLGDLPPSS